jgi:CRP-like cAMP-binding protein
MVISSLQNKIQILANSPLFADLPNSALEALAAAALFQQYQAGDRLLEEGDPCLGIYVIAEGRVKIFKTSSAGRQIQLAMETAPSSVAEIPLFDGGCLPASVSALTLVKTLLIRKEDFRRICFDQPEVALKVLAKVGQRLRSLVNLLEQVTFGNVRQRLAQTLLEFRQSAENATFHLPETHEQLAFRLGTVREVISRNLSRFQAEGLIKLDKRQITIVDAAGLRQETLMEL